MFFSRSKDSTEISTPVAERPSMDEVRTLYKTIDPEKLIDLEAGIQVSLSEVKVFGEEAAELDATAREIYRNYMDSARTCTQEQSRMFSRSTVVDQELANMTEYYAQLQKVVEEFTLLCSRAAATGEAIDSLPELAEPLAESQRVFPDPSSFSYPPLPGIHEVWGAEDYIKEIDSMVEGVKESLIASHKALDEHEELEADFQQCLRMHKRLELASDAIYTHLYGDGTSFSWADTVEGQPNSFYDWPGRAAEDEEMLIEKIIKEVYPAACYFVAKVEELEANVKALPEEE